MQEAVQLRVNDKNLVSHLRMAFTSRYTYLAELMQNARRAGASFVAFEYDPSTTTLAVWDDGKGIANMQDLLSIAESGWSDEVIEEESPYGMGFLSALFAAKQIEITSRGKRITFDTNDTLNFTPVTVNKSKCTDATIIRLIGIEDDPSKQLAYLAEGFAIRVLYNREELPRPYAIDSGLPFTDTQYGAMHIHQLHDEITFHIELGNQGMEVFLQGLPVYRCGYRYTNHRIAFNIVHLDPKRYKGRLPDRDKVVNQDQMIAATKKTISDLWLARLQRDVATMPAVTIADNYYNTLKHWEALSLLETVDYLPRNVLCKLESYPIFNDYSVEGYVDLPQSLSREAIENNLIHLAKITDEPSSSGDSFHVLMYAHRLGLKLFTGGLSSNHWIHQYITPLSNEDVTVTLHQVKKESSYSGGFVDVNVMFCEEVTLSGPLGKTTNDVDAFVVNNASIAIDDGPLNLSEEMEIVVPVNEQCGEVMNQCYHYMDEYDAPMETAQSDEFEKFERFILDERGLSQDVLVSRILNQSGLLNHDSLEGKSFTVTIQKEERYPHRSLSVLMTK